MVKIIAWCPEPKNTEIKSAFVEELGKRTNRTFEVEFRYAPTSETKVQATGKRIGPATVSRWSNILRASVKKVPYNVK